MGMAIVNPDNAGLQQFLRGKVSTMQEKEAEEKNMHELLKPYIVPDQDGTDGSLVPSDPPIIGNTADVAYQIRQINQCLQDAAEFKSQADEAKAFYDRRIEALEQRANFLKENVGRWLKLNGMQRLATHSGTIFFSKRTKVTLPDDEELLNFAKREDPDNKCGFIIEIPDKAELKKYIASSGHIPEGYMEEQTEQISIRKAA